MTEFRTITDGLRFPEGPIAMPDGSVVLVEIEAARLTRVLPDGGKEVIAETGGGPNGAAIGPDGACYICNNGGFNWEDTPERLRPVGQADDYSGGRIERVDMATGAVDVLFTHCGDVALRGPNDIVFDAEGGFYFTDLGKVRERDMDRGAVYYAKPDGSSITEVAFPVITPNGVGLSPDDKTVYVAETETSRLWSYEVLAPGELKTEPFPSVNGGRLDPGPGATRSVIPVGGGMEQKIFWGASKRQGHSPQRRPVRQGRALILMGDPVLLLSIQIDFCSFLISRHHRLGGPRPSQVPSP
jgi:gluconolactonase